MGAAVHGVQREIPGAQMGVSPSFISQPTRPRRQWVISGRSPGRHAGEKGLALETQMGRG